MVNLYLLDSNNYYLDNYYYKVIIMVVFNLLELQLCDVYNVI